MIRVALYQPEIPPNTGNIIRLCANTGAALHLIRPLGFAMDDRQLKRAGLDYHEYASVRVHDDFEAFIGELPASSLIWAFTTKGERRPTEAVFGADDVLLFGPETRGLPLDVLERLGSEQWLRLPMRPGSRSMNLSNAAAVAVYEVWRQLDWIGADR